jgi:hypothetical protein
MHAGCYKKCLHPLAIKARGGTEHRGRKKREGSVREERKPREGERKE